MKTICAWIGASLLVLAIAVLTVATAAEVRVARASGRRIGPARAGVPLQAAVRARPAPEASSHPR
jgi:hypothetical protein